MLQVCKKDSLQRGVVRRLSKRGVRMGSLNFFMMAAEIKGEDGQTLFEFLHMEILSHFMETHGKDAKVYRISYRLFTCRFYLQ